MPIALFMGEGHIFEKIKIDVPTTNYVASSLPDMIAIFPVAIQLLHHTVAE